VANCAFVIPGDITLATGGYAYDRRVLAGLAAHGVTVTHVALPGAWPNPGDADIEAAAVLLAGLPADTTLLIDGLAYGVFPSSLLARIKQRVVALCHHPLGLETGIDPDRARELVLLETAALARADRIVVTSNLTKRLIGSDFAVAPELMTVAEPGTDRAERSYGGDGPTINLLAVGSIVPRKGYLVLLDALARIDKRGLGNWHLDVVGSVRDQAEYQRVVGAIEEAGLGDRVALLGAVNDDNLEALYQNADLFVMPSLFEGYGMVLGEAMARGVPILCTTGGAAAETVPDGAGVKVPPGDVEALAEELGNCIADPSGLRDMADPSWAAGQNLPTWDDTCRIIASVIKGTTT
jgi:glycosyltransferase involved in cell wall biosynthesis